MHRSTSIRRGIVVTVAAAGLLALSVGGAQANEAPAEGVLGGVASDVTHGARHTIEDVGTPATKSVHRTVHRTVRRVTAGATAPRTAEKGAQQNAGKAATHATQKAGTAVSTASSAAAHPGLGAVSGVPAAASAPSAPGLPEDLVIEIPQLLPGVPSIGILPASLPALLPFTPTIPVI